MGSDGSWEDFLVGTTSKRTRLIRRTRCARWSKLPSARVYRRNFKPLNYSGFSELLPKFSEAVFKWFLVQVRILWVVDKRAILLLNQHPESLGGHPASCYKISNFPSSGLTLRTLSCHCQVLLSLITPLKGVEAKLAKKRTSFCQYAVSRFKTFS
jgi:hypothetical protein